MASKNHIHKYKYVNIGSAKNPNTKVYACSLPDCSHFIPAHMSRLIIGKESICHKCNEKMIISTEHWRNKTVKPKCYKCMGWDKPKHVKPLPKVEQVKTDAAIDMLLRMRLGDK